MQHKRISTNEPASGRKYVIGHSLQKTSLKFEPNAEPIPGSAVQEELSKSITLLKRVERCLIVAHHKNDRSGKQQFKSIATTLQLAIALLQENPDQFLLARRLRRNAEFTIREFTNPIIGRLINAFKYVLYESTTPVKVLFGLGLALPIYLTVPHLPYQRMIVQPLLQPILAETQPIVSRQDLSTSRVNPPPVSRYDVDRTIALLVLVGIAGSLGSVVSILTRIKEYENEKYTDTMLPVLIGAFKPLIGGSFGIFLFTLIASGLLPLQIKNDAPINEWYAFFGIAFVAGFSERLVKDIISQTERRVLATSETTPTIDTTRENMVATSETTSTISQRRLEGDSDQNNSSIEKVEGNSSQGSSKY